MADKGGPCHHLPAFAFGPWRSCDIFTDRLTVDSWIRALWSDTSVVCTSVTETTSAGLRLRPEVFPLPCFHCLLLPYKRPVTFSCLWC